jgi:hypothetical protein
VHGGTPALIAPGRRAAATHGRLQRYRAPRTVVGNVPLVLPAAFGFARREVDLRFAGAVLSLGRSRHARRS